MLEYACWNEINVCKARTRTSGAIVWTRSEPGRLNTRLYQAFLRTASVRPSADDEIPVAIFDLTCRRDVDTLLYTVQSLQVLGESKRRNVQI